MSKQALAEMLAQHSQDSLRSNNRANGYTLESIARGIATNRAAGMRGQ